MHQESPEQFKVVTDDSVDSLSQAVIVFIDRVDPYSRFGDEQICFSCTYFFIPTIRVFFILNCMLIVII